jgi:DNA-binding helix-turn-helix protein
MKTMGSIFKEYRKKERITQRELADLLNCSLQSIAKIETNKSNAGPKILTEFLKQRNIDKETRKIIFEYKKQKKEKKVKTTSKEQNENYSYEDMLKIKAVLSEYATTNRLVKVMWDFREFLFKYFQEIDLLLSTNEFKTNKKMEKGILKVSEDLDDMSKKMKKHLDRKIIDAQIL